MYIIEKLFFYFIYLLCFFHISVLSRGHGGSHGGGHSSGHGFGHGGGHGGYHVFGYSGSRSHTSSESQRVCWINVTSENGTHFEQKSIICHTCCKDGCCFIDTFNEVFGVVFIITIILVFCYYVFFKKKTSKKDIDKEENLPMQTSGINNVASTDGVQNYGSNSYVNAAMSVEDLPSKLDDSATLKPSVRSLVGRS